MPEGAEVRYSIAGGNRDGLFTIDQRSGTITLAAALDHELSDQHELVVTAEGEGAAARVLVLVRVGDVNDNPPEFVRPAPRLTVIEEDDRDLPATITRVEVTDADSSDAGRLVFRLSGDGVDNQAEGDEFFTVNARTGDLIQLRALDRDPPQGRAVWRLRVEVRDGQGHGEGQEAPPPMLPHPRPPHVHRQASWGHQDPENPNPTQIGPRNLFSGGGEAVGKTEYKRQAPIGPGRKEKHRLSPRSTAKEDVSLATSGNSLITAEGRAQRITAARGPRTLKKSRRWNQVAEEAIMRPSSNGEVTTGDFSQTGTRKEIRKLAAFKPEEKPFPEDKAWYRRQAGGEAFTTAPKARILQATELLGDGEYQNTNHSLIPYSSKVALHNPFPYLQPHTTTSTTGATGPHHRGKQHWVHSSHLHMKNKSDSTTLPLQDDAKNGCEARSNHVGAAPHDLQMRDVSASREPRFVKYYLRDTSYGAGKQQDESRGVRRRRQTRQQQLHREQGTTLTTTANKATGSGDLDPRFRMPVGNARLVLPSSYANDPPGPYGTLNSDPKPRIKGRVLHGPRLTAWTDSHRPYDPLTSDTKAKIKGRLADRTEEGPRALNTDPGSTSNIKASPRRKRETFDTSSSEFRSSVNSLKQEDPFTEVLMPGSHDNPDSEPFDAAPEISSANLLSGYKTTTRRANQETTRTLLMEESLCEEVGTPGQTAVNTSGGDEGAVAGRENTVHVVETVVTVVVKDINDNSPVFPNTTMLGHVKENGPAGEAVVVVSAWDADDAADGSNARLTYAIEKNVVDEGSSAAIFLMEPHTGLVRTARCCLDRETTPEYQIQVVASDGGGLKGTGTVVVRVADENDNSPRLARRLWELEVEETPLAAPPPNTTLLELTAADRDVRNTFLYRVVPGSGHGWENFGVRSVGASGQLFALKSLDYEQETHRRGFRFMVQVTDQGPRGWEDLNHLDSAWVTVKLRDVNDNPPLFARPHAHVTVREDTAPGTSLAALLARDPDAGGTQGVDYRVEGGGDAFSVDGDGGVSLMRQLDREAPGGDEVVVLVVAVDRGSPALSATATLAVTVTDVNDCPPYITPPTLLHVTEGAPPTRLGVLKVTDPDVWALGHGPPFTLSLAPSNPAHVFSMISLKFDLRLDSGRGGAELWTSGPLDREDHRQLSVAVLVSDAQGLTATHRLTVLVDDLNDNPMKPAAKTVYLWKTQGGGSDAPLGRVFVEDPDDWDLDDKEFEWSGPPHPLFTLRPDGALFASSQTREGRYDLRFSVSDRAWRQRGVAANVTVVVRLLTPEALAHAAPLALMPTTPADLTRGWSPSEGGGRLGALLKEVVAVLEERDVEVEVVSVYGGCSAAPPPSHPRATAAATPPAPANPASPSTCVWVSAKDSRGTYLDPVKIQGLLTLHTRQIMAATNLTVTAQPPPPAAHTLPGRGTDAHVHSVTSLASTSPPLQVVDTNATSLVTPRLTHAAPCHALTPDLPAPSTCLNGGRFFRGADGRDRCVCPGRTWGARCKVLSRTFWGSGWAWLRPLPPCLPLTLSLHLLTRHPHGLLLYAGPLSPSLHKATPAPMVALQLVDGRPQALVETAGGALKLQVNKSLHDGHWHSLHLILDHQSAVLMVDRCGRGWGGTVQGDAHCLARGRWRVPQPGGAWLSSAPLQVGGFAHLPPLPEEHGWREAPTHHHLNGCLARLTISTQLTDLGEPAYTHASVGGCRPQDTACPRSCGVRGHCIGGLEHPQCECDSGLMGPECSSPTVPARLGAASYMKVALSFTPAPQVLRLQVRVRMRGARTGLLLHLASHHRASAFTLHMQAGVACASVSGTGWATRRACVSQRPLGDGVWHTVAAERHGHNLWVSVDDGDGWSYNETLESLETLGGARPPPPLLVDKHDGLTVGGLPEFTGVNLVTVHNDLQNACLDDIRVSHHQLPLPPAVNGTPWGQVTTQQHLLQGCHPPGNPCANTTCAAPLSCRAVWDQPSCSCGPGTQLVDGACEDVDECLWRPCLHGGSCLNLRPGYLCVCGPGHLGDHCQWSELASNGHPLAAPAAIAAITVSILVLVVLGVVLSLRLHRLRGAQGPQAGAEKGDIQSVRGTTIDSSEGERVGKTGVREDSSDTLVELLKLRVSREPSDHQREGSVSLHEWDSCGSLGSVTFMETKLPLAALHSEDPHKCACEGVVPLSRHSSSPVSALRTCLDLHPSSRPASGPLEVSDLLHNLPPVPCPASPHAGLHSAGGYRRPSLRGRADTEEGEVLEHHCTPCTSPSRG